MGALKDIAHNFISTDDEKQRVLDILFEIEDQNLLNFLSDYVFGIYKKISPNGESLSAGN